MEQIKTLDQLIELASDEDGVECYISLNGGLRSSKKIWYLCDGSKETFDVLNEIDDSFQEDLTYEQLKRETNIIEALEKGALIKYD